MAITDLYVSSAGAGSGDGSSAANARSWANMIADINGGGKAGNHYNILGPIARTTTTDTISGSGSATSPIVIRGYASAIGDGYLGRALGGTGLLTTTNMPAISYTTGRLNVSGSWITLESLNLSGATAGAFLGAPVDGSVVRCLITYTGTDAAGTCVTCAARSALIDNDIIMAGASGGLAAVNATSTLTRIYGNRIKGNTAAGVILNGSGSTAVVRNLIYRGTQGIITSGATASIVPYIIDNTIVNNSSDGIQLLSTSTGLQVIFGNRITDNGGYGINGQAVTVAIIAAYNRLDRNTSGATNSSTDSLAAGSYGHVTTAVAVGAEYAAQASDDYRLLPTAPAANASGIFNGPEGVMVNLAQGFRF